MLGRYHDIALFFDRVGKLPRIVTFQDLDLGGGRATPSGLKLTASCRATTFKFLDAVEKAALDKGKAAPKKAAGADKGKEGAT